MGFWKIRHIRGGSMSMSIAASLKTDFLKKINGSSEFLNGISSSRTKRNILVAACRDWLGYTSWACSQR